MSAEISKNRKARHEYHILDTYEAGLELKGTEVKSIRAGKVNIADSFARIEKGQLFLFGCDIQPWETAGTWFQHQTRRPRRLLVHKAEILKLDQETSQKGCTLICLRMYWQNRRVKVEIGVAKGKSHADKRNTLKENVENREAQREMQRFNKGY
ncbi:SsrA-binding protein SmpB [Rubritalea sp.]|uniref:SsrA-binding protein SmpB n=1 Tax=Rubritalea sp. TaxID=2109375 RepID=UPI003EF39AD7